MNIVKTCETCGKEYRRSGKNSFAQYFASRFCSRGCVIGIRKKVGEKTRYHRGHNGHRAVMERAIGRKLLTHEHVHHINGDKLDNRVENLEIIDARLHGLSHHPPVHPIEKDCVVCGASFVPHKTKRKRQQTCSWQCSRMFCARQRWGKPRAVIEALK